MKFLHSPLSSSELGRLDFGLHALGAAIGMVLIASGYAMAFLPMNRELESARGQELALRQFLEQQATLNDEYQQATVSLARQEGRLDDLLKRIPRTPEEADFLGQLTTLAESSDLLIHGYNPGRPADQGSHSTLEIEVEAIASYEAICRFLNGLADLPRLCQLTSLQVRSDVSAEGDYDVTMQIRIYFTPLHEPAGEEERV